MSNRLNYIKKFIIFKDDYSNMKGLKSKGHGKLELKGNNLNVSLNIKGAEANNFYNIELIKRREAYTLGKIYTKEDKSAEREIDLSYRELEKNGFPLEEVDGIILSRDSKVLFGEKLKGTGKSLEAYIEQLAKEDQTPTKEDPILFEDIEDEDIEDEIKIEYIEDDIETIEDVEETVETIFIEEEVLEEEAEEAINVEYIQVMTEEITEEVEEEIEEVNEEVEEVIGEDTEEILIEEVEELAIEEELEEVKTEIFESSPEETEDVDDMFSEKKYEEIMEEIFHIPELGYENHIDVDESDIDNKNQTQANEMSEYVKNILNFFPHSEPFTMTLEGYDWWKIDMEELDGNKSFLPYFGYIIGGNNKSNRFEEGIDPKSLLDKYGHYIFGLYNEGESVKFYMYGIPGKFSLEDYPRGGSAGFNTWFEGIEVPGYWVIYIEPETGKILYPINPMIPKA